MTYAELAILTKDFYLKVHSRHNILARKEVKAQIELLAETLDKKREEINCYCGNKHTNVVSDVMNHIQSHTVKIHNLTQELSKPFLLFLVGTGKFGKSTLINALLGCQMAQVDILPKTWKIDVFYGGHDNKAEIRYRDGHREYKTFAETKKIVQEEEDKREVSEDKVQAIFEEERGHLKTVLAKKERQDELRKYMLYRSDITEIHWPVPMNPLLKNFRLVDTPGTQQQMTIGYVEATAADYYSKADGILWLLAADKISAKDTRENVDAVLNRFGRRTDNIVAVLNKKDLIEKNGGREAMQRVISEARSLYGDVFKEIVPVSASQALKGVLDTKQRTDNKIKQNQGSALEESGLNKLLEVIDRYFMTRAQKIQVESKILGTYSIFKDIDKEVESLRQRLHSEAARRDELESKWEKEKQELLSMAREGINACFEAQIELVHHNAMENEEALWEMEGEERNKFLQNEIFKHESFNRKAEKMILDIYENITTAKNIHVQEAAFYEYPDLHREKALIKVSSGSLIKPVKLDNEVFSTGDGKLVVGGIAALGACALLGPIGLLAGLAAQSDSFKSLTKWVSKLFVNLPNKITSQYSEQLEGIKKQIDKELVDMLNNAGLEVQAVREKTYADLYGPSDVTRKILDSLVTITQITMTKVKEVTLKDVILGTRKG